ncbi:contact-dependent growth inhibition system immunity protein [Aquimarina sp. Aq78]|uniref:contact-dependent growth inhibition system immunity protein n=1 Tax=Aquimarina sp. Aq78 TaxID=1191889 RepID=UPI000D0E774F|nr:contact-dependent growth inhibition system immunity protein [Aquimarina sp. Aq78]
MNLEKTINQLQDIPIPRPPEYESHLVRRCFDLANKKLKYFSPEDLRIMIGQNIGLEYLIPIALEVLQREPFIEADYYEGDLFLSVFKVDKVFWEKNLELKEKILSVFKDNLDDFKQLDLDTQEDLYKEYEKL